MSVKKVTGLGVGIILACSIIYGLQTFWPNNSASISRITAETAATDIFGGTIARQLEQTSIDGKTFFLFEVNVSRAQEGGATGAILVAFPEDAKFIPKGGSLKDPWMFNTVFDQDSNQYVVVTGTGPITFDYIKPQYSVNFSDDSKLVGASHNVFVGKVLAQMGTKDLGMGPETQFDVEIIQNIKGNLEGTVVVNQVGGYTDNILHIVAEAGVGGEGYLLDAGSTYVFATRFNREQNWYTLNTYPTARKKLSIDSAADRAGLVAIVGSDARVQQLKAAYPNEVLLATDLDRNNALNSYASVQASMAVPKDDLPAEQQVEIPRADSTSPASGDAVATTSLESEDDAPAQTQKDAELIGL